MSEAQEDAVEQTNSGATRPVTPKPASSRKGGRPVTWIGGGGLSPSFVASKGVPELRALFLEVFGHPTASNNSTWLRRKLSEPPDATFGRGRSAKIRRRDLGAAIWTTGTVSSFTQAEASMLQKTGGNLPGNNIIPLSASARQSMTGSETSSGFGSPSCTPRKRSRQSAPTPLELLMQQLKQLACQAYWVDSPPTIEVFWPEEEGGGSWWPARVLKVMPKKLMCSVLYDTSESEDLNLKEMLEMKHIRVIDRRPEEDVSDSSWIERDAKCLKPLAAGSIADAVCNSVKSELQRMQQEDGVPAMPVVDADHEAMLQTIMEETPVPECAFPHIDAASAAPKMPNGPHSAQPELSQLHLPQLLAPVKVKFDSDQALGSLDTKGSDASAGSCEMWSPDSVAEVPDMDMYPSQALNPEMFKRDHVPVPPPGPPSDIADFVHGRLQGVKDRSDVGPNIFDEDFMTVGLNTLIDEEASSSQAMHNMAMTSLLPYSVFY